jgi:hypothetical protein
LFPNRAKKIEPVAAQDKDEHSDEAALSSSTHALAGDSDKELDSSEAEHFE